MGTKELEALIAVLERAERRLGREGHVAGHVDDPLRQGARRLQLRQVRGARFYCNERPSLIALDGAVLEPGRPARRGVLAP